jgi:hypothetical protein
MSSALQRRVALLEHGESNRLKAMPLDFARAPERAVWGSVGAPVCGIFGAGE